METQTNKLVLADEQINSHTLWAMGAGIIPLPIADFIAVGAVQIDLIRELSQLYHVTFRASQGKALISAVAGTSLARLGSSVIKSIPGVGSVLGGASAAVLSGASTYALGEVFKKHFEAGGNLEDFDLKALKKYYDKKFEKGKEVVKEMKTNNKPTKSIENEPAMSTKSNELLLRNLRELEELRKAGVITESEFEKLKARLIS